MTNYLDPKVIAHRFEMAQKRGFPLVRRADWACGRRSGGMTPIRSALKTGSPRSKGYRPIGSGMELQSQSDNADHEQVRC
jgi:hypothetical protein